jgi:N-acyl amino acid synthase of PEP-CTERM/exosortase system
MWIQMLLGKRDILVPYFKFRKEVRGNLGSLLLEEIFRLRYEVYCLECQFLPSDDFQNGLEIDEYDSCATHFVACTHEDMLIGAVRLVQPGHNQVYPFENHCSVFDDYVMPPKEQVGEASRLVIRKNYRRRRGDSLEGIPKDFRENGAGPAIRPHSGGRLREGNGPMLLLGLYREMFRYSKQNGIHWWYAAMELPLVQSLEKLGFLFVPIGPQSDYFGPVTPFILNLDEVHQHLREKNKFLAAWFNDEAIPLSTLVQVLAEKLWRKFFKKK